MSYGVTGCEVQTNFDVCIQNAGGSLDPKGWAKCQSLVGNNSQFNNCVYEGYNSIITCFTGFCNNDASGTINTIKAAYEQYKSYVQEPAAQQNVQTGTTQQGTTQQGTTQQGTAQQGTTQQGTTQQGTTQQGTAQGNITAANNTVNSNSEINSGASSNKVSKILVSFLVVSGLLMNFL